jgi:phosphatidylglycerol---prolipoprotein diacylglyceryl transferase
MFVIAFPNIDPVAFEIGPLQIRWYALAYIAGLVLGWRYALYLATRSPHRIKRQDVDDFLSWATLGVVLGGRLGYVLFYKPLYYLYHPLEIFAVWQGGMSFHGGALGVIVAIIWFCRRRGIPMFAFADLVCVATPIGLFFGRIANFINGELWGRVSDAPWAMVFPTGGPEPRHPSQLYQAGMEGLILFALLAWLFFGTRLRYRAGALSGVFLLGYGVARFIGEFFRQPDAHLGFLFLGTTMGQLLSLPLALAGIWLIARAQPKTA